MFVKYDRDFETWAGSKCGRARANDNINTTTSESPFFGHQRNRDPSSTQSMRQKICRVNRRTHNQRWTYSRRSQQRRHLIGTWWQTQNSPTLG